MTTFDKNNIIYSCDLIHGETSPTSDSRQRLWPSSWPPGFSFGHKVRCGWRGTHFTQHFNRVRVWWSDVLRHPLHLIKQLILLQKDSGLWFTRGVTDITWFPRQQRLSLHSPRRSGLESRFDERLRPRLQSDIRVPIFTCWWFNNKNLFENVQADDTDMGQSRFVYLSCTGVINTFDNIRTTSYFILWQCVCMCLAWGSGLECVCDGSWLSHKSKLALSSLIFTSTADHGIKDNVYVFWREQSAILL